MAAARLPLRCFVAGAGALVLAVGLIQGPGPADAQVPGVAAATVLDADGAELGSVVLFSEPQQALLVHADLEGLTPGFHGFHIHAESACDPDAEGGPFTTAGGHLGHDDPDETPHGAHAGDLPALLVNADGTARQELLTDRFTLEDVVGRSVIVHAEPDSFAHVPDRYASDAEGAPERGADAATRTTGDAGARIACGEITLAVQPLPEMPGGEESRSTLVVGPHGQATGFVSFTTVDGGVRVDADGLGLTPGFHGFHVHVGPHCTDEAGRIDFGGAQGHWNPGGGPHGDHAGDMPVLLARASGRYWSSFVTDRIPSVEALDARAVVVHADPDNAAHIPDRYSAEAAPERGPDATTLATGDAGARDRCGIVGGTALRLSGPGRIQTAVAISRSAFPDEGEAGAVVLARSDRFADGLAGTPLAVANGGPVLLTEPDALDGDTAAELQRVLFEGGTVYVLGGEAALSSEVEATVAELGYVPVRLAGTSRVETAIEVARELEDPSVLLITTGFRFPDALAAGAAAGRIGGAVVLTTSDERHPSLDAYLEDSPDAELFAIGGPAARPYAEAEPVVGADRVATAVLVAETFFSEPLSVGVARSGGTGDDDDPAFADALAGGAHAAWYEGPVLLTPSASLHINARAYVEDNAEALQLGYLYGGTAALDAEVFTGLHEAIRPPTPG